LVEIEDCINRRRLRFRGSALHTAAGTLLASEAGATVSNIDGRPWSIRSDSVIASANPSLHEEMLALARATATDPSGA
jgi:fructose-1,6-bisphosphatase/inositol monophosphatase family enzyme